MIILVLNMPLRCGILIHSRIESIQRRATKFILKSEDEYLVRLRELRLLSLEDKRFMADVVFF